LNNNNGYDKIKVANGSYSNLQRSSTRTLQERSLDIGRALKSVNLIQRSLDCRANVEQFNHQCFERSAKICEPLDIEVNKPGILIGGTNCSPKAFWCVGR
jgi:hypothetical protein